MEGLAATLVRMLTALITVGVVLALTLERTDDDPLVRRPLESASVRSLGREEETSSERTEAIDSLVDELEGLSISREEVIEIVSSQGLSTGQIDDIRLRNHDTAAMRISFEKTERTLDRILQSSKNVNDKAISLMQTNGVFLTIFAGASTQVPISEYVNAFTTLGTVCFFGSITFSALGYQGWSKTAGYSRIKTLITLRQTEEEYLLQSLNDYNSLITDPIPALHRSSKRVELGLSLLLSGFVLFTAGVFIVALGML